MAKKQVHVHFHNERAPTRDADDKDGHWVTIHGAHIFIGKGGKIEKGPKGFVGKTPSDLGKHVSERQGKSSSHHNEMAHYHAEHEAHKEGASERAQHVQRLAETHRNAAHAIAQGAQGQTARHVAELKGMTQGTGSEELEKYGAYFRKGDKVRANVTGSKTETVMGHVGSQVSTYSNNSYHPTKVMRAESVPAYRGRESGPAEGSKGEAALVKAGGPLSEKDKADIAAYNKEQAANPPKKLGMTAADLKKERPPSKAALRGQAKGEYELAGRGHGSYAKAAELYEQAGSKDKAEEAMAMARRYGHTPEAVAARKKEDLANAARVRAEAEKYTGTVRETLLREAALHEKLAAEDAPRGTDKTVRELRAAQDDSAHELSLATKPKLK